MDTILTYLFVDPPEEDGVDVGKALTVLMLVLEGSVGLVSTGTVLVLLVLAAAPKSRGEFRFSSLLSGAVIGRTCAVIRVARMDKPAIRNMRDFMIIQKVTMAVQHVH